MVRFGREHVQDTAQRFAASWRAGCWTLFGSSMRDALIDSFIMDELRIADSVDSIKTVTATDVIRFREAVAQALAEGVRPKNTRRPKCAYRVYE